MASSTEELDLLERVFLRIGSAESDEQLEAAINKFLIPVLLKLSSPNEGVRKKVMELLVHVNKRVKRRPTVQLPVEALMTHYRDPKASSFLINFSILYIKLGFPRLPLAKQEELAPSLLLACEGKPKIHQDGLLLLLMSVIGSIKVPTDPEKRKELFKMDEKPELMKHLSSFMLDVLLLPYAFISSAPEEESASGSGSAPTAPQAPPGMSEYGMKRVTSGETPMTPERLEQIKLGIVKFLGTGVLSNDEIICHLIIAAADTRFTVANLADTELRRIAGSVNWSNVAIANKLFHIYLGSPEVPADKRNPIPQANRIVPANTRIRLKILPYLSRLEKDAILFPGSIQVIFNSLYDVNTNPKLKLQALNFALAIVRRSDIQAMNKMGGMLYTGLLKLVWNTEESEQLRVVGYTIIGQIVKRLPHIINKNLIELQVFFENLSCDQTDIKNAVRDSLLTMVDAFKLFMEGEREKMEVDEEPKNDSKDSLPNRELIMMALLSSQIEAKEPTSRFVAVKYTAAVFPSDHVPSRYLLLLSAGDSNSDVSSTAAKSLYSSFEGEENEVKKILLPEFSDIIRCVYEKTTARMKNPNQMITVQNTNLPFNVTTFIEILTYLRLCLAKSSKVNLSSKELIVHPCDQSPLIGRYVYELHKSDPSLFDNYLNLVEMVLPVSSSIVPLSCLVEVFGTCPELFAGKYSEKLPWIMNFLNNTKEEIREIAAILLSIVCSATMDDGKLHDTLMELLKMSDNKSLETQHGAILSLGNIIERKIIGYGAKEWTFPKEIIVKLVEHLDSTNSLLISPACIALGLIAKSTPLPLPNESDDNLSKKGLLNKLIEIIKNAKLSSKIKERAIQTCGLLCLGEDFPYAKELLDKFLEISKETKDIDIHFSIGESIILCIEGISSAQKRDLWKVEKTEYVSVAIPDKNLKLLNELLDNLLTLSRQPHPNIRQSVCVYLLLIVKRLSSLPVVKEKLPHIQATFMDLLSENSELVQDMASKGLALVYENTTEENKKELVNGLLDQLLAGRRDVQKVTSNTKLFEEGQLGTAPSGGNLSTYKEICSLASDLNQPDLVYKFMHLANHNAIWNSKKGAAFGFQTIATQANDQLNEYLPKIIPRLYRYQFDPTPKIQQSMANIWHSLVKDSQKTIDKYYNEILDDLLYNLTSNQWRVRHSCCLALADFFRANRSILDAKHKLPELWKSLFRVMDDVHEGTRLAAQNTSKTLSRLCVRVCNTELGKVNQEMLDVVLSVFLSGITNSVAEVRNLSLQAVSQLVNSAGSSLKPTLPTLIPSLLEAAGELESVGLSYLSAQYGAQRETQEMIDSVRANAAKSHYTTQTVAKCVQYVELDMLPSLVSRVTEIMKSVNLGSRVACAHLIILLAHHLGRSMEQFTGKFLSALVNGLLDRNATVRKTYASTIGQIVHTARSTSMEKLTTKLSNWYFEKEDLNTRTAIGLTLQAIAQYNGELLKEQFPIVIPLIFFAMHSQKIEGEDNSHVVMWEDIWNEVTPGSEAGMKQHMNEICKILETALTSPSWTMKAQGARCVSTIAIKIGDSLESSHRDQLIGTLLKSLQGKTFPGKEDLLKGLSKLATHCSEKLKESPEKCQEIVDCLLRECNKSELGYKRQGLEALGSVLESFDNIDCFKQVYDIVKDLLKKLDQEGEEGETSEELTKSRNEKYKTIEVVYETLGKSWPRNKATQLEYQDLLLNECYKALERSPRDIQVAILTALRCYLEKLHYFNEEHSTTQEENKNVRDILDKTTQALHFSLGVVKHTRLRKEALNITFTLGNKLISTGRNEELQTFTNALKGRLQELEKDPTPEVRTRLMDLKEMFKN